MSGKRNPPRIADDRPNERDSATGRWNENNRYSYRPGESGNPGGRPRAASITSALYRELAKHPDADGIGAKAGELAKNMVRWMLRDPDFTARVIKNMQDRLEGVPVTQIDATVRSDVTEINLGSSPTTVPCLPADDEEAPEGA